MKIISAIGQPPRHIDKSLNKNNKWDLRLYVDGHAPRGLTAFNNLKQICEEELRGKYRITVFDLQAQPQLACDEQIIAIPTLVRKSPRPTKHVIGDLSDKERVITGLDINRR